MPLRFAIMGHSLGPGGGGVEFVSAAEVRRLLVMSDCITLMRAVLIDLSRGEVDQPLRSMMTFGERKILGQMPAWLKRQNVVGTKIITVVPSNRDLGRPSHQGVIVLFSATDGTPMAEIDADSVTAIRTAAVSGAATRALARDDARVLALLGTGAQARTHLHAMLKVRHFSHVVLWGPHAERAEACRDELATDVDVPISCVRSVRQAVADADVICTLTSATEPILLADDVKPGTHINAVGASRAIDRELDGELVARCRLYVDRRDSAEHEAGDFLLALQEGWVGVDHVVGDLGELFLGRVAGRQKPDDITLFKSLGLAVEDVAAAHYVYERKLAEIQPG